MPSELITELYMSDAPLRTLRESHRHNAYQMIYIAKGSLRCEIAGKPMLCQAPALIFLGNCEPHIMLSASEQYVRYVLTLDPARADECLRPAFLTSVFSFHPVDFAHVLDITPIADEVQILMESLQKEYRPAKEKKEQEGEAMLLSALLYRIRQFSPAHFTEQPHGAAETLVTSVRTEVERNFAQRLKLAELAERYHVSRYYLAHLFKQMTGYSLKEYQMICRISFACQQLSDGNGSVREIAESSGFGDMSNFSRAFKERIGMSPSDFRKKSFHDR